MADQGKTCKLILLGNGSVGKTSICQRFLDDGFSKVYVHPIGTFPCCKCNVRRYKQTVGLDTYSKQLSIRGKDLVLSVWDIGGQAVNSKMLTKYITGADVAFLCFDLTDHASFSDVEAWSRKISSACTMANASPPKSFLLGNKVDLVGQRVITADQIIKGVQEYKCSGHFEVSAQSGDAVPRAFYSAAANVLGMELSAHELEFHDTVVSATVVVGGEEDNARVKGSEAIEAEDAAAQAQQQEGCSCTIM